MKVKQYLKLRFYQTYYREITNEIFVDLTFTAKNS